MEFLDYKNEVERIIERKARHLNKDVTLSLEKMFEAYINDVNPIDFIKTSISLNESTPRLCPRQGIQGHFPNRA